MYPEAPTLKRDYNPHMEHEGDHMEMQPTERKVLTEQDIREHIGNPENLVWVEAGELEGDVSEWCVDGREAKGVIATAGGNAGEFVLMVQAAEETTGKQLSETDIIEFFRAYLQKFGKFYMHSDEHGLEHILKVLSSDDVFKEQPLQSEKDVESLLRQCPMELRDALIAHLTNPDNMGCGHLKLLIKEAAEYGVRPEIVRAMVKAYFTEMWQANPEIEFRVLPGDHEEGAVVLVAAGDGPFDSKSRVPTIAPMANGTSFFANHPQAIEYLRDTIAQETAADGLIDDITPENVAAYQAKITELGNKFLGKTVEKLAVFVREENGQKVKYTLPIFEVKFTSETDFEVKEIAPSRKVA